MTATYQHRAFKFFLLTLLITWGALAAAAYFSFSEHLARYQYVFITAAVLTPCAVAMLMIFGSGNGGLKRDFTKRLTDLKLIRPAYVLAILLLMPLTVLLATAVSLLFGQQVDQFALSPGFSLTRQAAVMLIVLLFAPTFEELGWRGYGVDSLRKPGRSILTATLIFALLWALWHIPLFLIKGYYHYEMLHEDTLYALNFVVSIFPAAFLANWIYYRNGRSIPGNILFHVILNLSMSALQTAQFTKCIVTVILILVSLGIYLQDTSWWLRKAGYV